MFGEKQPMLLYRIKKCLKRYKLCTIYSLPNSVSDSSAYSLAKVFTGKHSKIA